MKVKLKKKNHIASKIIARNFKERGITKGKRKCFQMFTSRHEFYWTIHEANQRPRHEPVPCPYGEALHGIFRQRLENKDSSGLLYIYIFVFGFLS